VQQLYQNSLHPCSLPLHPIGIRKIYPLEKKRMKSWCKLIVFCLLSLPMFGADTYSAVTTFNYQAQHQYCKTHGCLNAIPRTGIGSNFKRHAYGGDGDAWAIDTSANLWHWETNTWVELSSGAAEVAVVSFTQVYVLGASGVISMYDGTSWTNPFGTTTTFRSIAASQLDGSICGIHNGDYHLLCAYSGSTLFTDTGLYLLANQGINTGQLAVVSRFGVWLLANAVTGGFTPEYCAFSAGFVPAGCNSPGGAAQEIVATDTMVAIVSNAHAVSYWAGSTSDATMCTTCWVQVQDTATTLAVSKAELFAVQSASGNAFHFNFMEPFVNSQATFAGSTLPPPCAPDQTYLQALAVATFDVDSCPTEHKNSQQSYLPATLDTGLVQDFMSACDVQFAPGAPSTKCGTHSTAAQVTCAAAGTIATVVSMLDPTGPCPYYPPFNQKYWEPGIVTVYIDSGYWANGSVAEQNICAGFQSWEAVDGKAYGCVSTIGPPVRPQQPYVFVTGCEPTAGCTGTHSVMFFNRDFPWIYGSIYHVDTYMRKTLTPATNYKGLAAHENGHFEGFEDCPMQLETMFGLGQGCPASHGGVALSVMGPQPSSNLAGLLDGGFGAEIGPGTQPQGPTSCDAAKWGKFYLP
jgi:hypothetical protein